MSQDYVFTNLFNHVTSTMSVNDLDSRCTETWYHQTWCWPIRYEWSCLDKNVVMTFNFIILVPILSFPWLRIISRGLAGITATRILTPKWCSRSCQGKSCLCLYIYIYTHTHIYIYIFISPVSLDSIFCAFEWFVMWFHSSILMKNAYLTVILISCIIRLESLKYRYSCKDISALADNWTMILINEIT